ncbi:MAG: flagellar basal body L-ring protein FlgH [Planctomycetes bacterium]|nr:flagellar basal body L-ring protein FlgH [Planctomycetota bacterium]
MKMIAALTLLAATLSAQSLWNATRPMPPLTSDAIARQVGDLLTVMISEKQTIKNKEQVDYGKAGSLNAALTSFDVLPGMFGTLPGLSAEHAREFSGNGQYDKEGSFQTRLAVVVIDVQPNGNLIIEGRRQVLMDKEKKTVRITGVVRPFDISGANSVMSENIANASIVYEGDGPLTRATNKGWLSELVDHVWPF